MLSHSNYFEFKAKSNYDLGLQLGEHFKDAVKTRMSKIERNSSWVKKLKRAKEYLEFTKQYFPQYVREIEGYAQGAGVDFI